MTKRYLVKSIYRHAPRQIDHVARNRFHGHPDKHLVDDTWHLTAEVLDLARLAYPNEDWIVVGEICDM